jgi:hypothetical protein
MTVVLVGYLGCPAAMTATKDLTEHNDKIKCFDKFETVFIFENTAEQIKDFNSNEANNWSELRKYFNLKPILNNVISDCESENLKAKGKDIIIDRQCRNISKTLHTIDSPTIFIVKDNKIIGRLKGYYGSTDQAERLAKLDRLINACS